MQGLPESSVDGRTLLYQLIMVQAVCEKRSDFSQVPPLVNNHPMLQDSALIDTKSARSLYEKLLVHYGVVQGEDEDMEDDSDGEKPKQEPDQEPEQNEDNSKDVEANIDQAKSKNNSESPAQADGESGPDVKAEATEDQAQPESSDQPAESGTSTPKCEAQNANAASPAAEQGTSSSSHVANLDKLVGLLYMKYTHELLQTIDEDKKEFSEVFASIKP